MPKEIKELRAFTKGTVSTMAPEDLPDEAAHFSLDVENSSEYGILQGRYADIATHLNHNPSHYYKDISRFTPGVDRRPYRDLIFVKLIAGIRPSGSPTYGSGDGVTISTDDAEAPFTCSIGMHSKWMTSGGSEVLELQDISTSGDISMESTGKAVHIGFGGDPNVEPPKWVGHFGHDRFDYSWNTAQPYIEEDWITTQDLIKDFDILTHSLEDANLYDSTTYPTPDTVFHHYVTAAKFSGSVVAKIDVSEESPRVVVSSENLYTGITSITQAWNRWSANLLVEHSTGDDNSEKFTTGVGGWSVVDVGTFIEEATVVPYDRAAWTTSGGTSTITHQFESRKGNNYTLEMDLEMDTGQVIEMAIGTTAGGTDIHDWEEIATDTTESLVRNDDGVTASSGYIVQWYSNTKSYVQFFDTLEQATTRDKDLYISLKLTDATNTTMHIDNVRLFGCCNNVGLNSKIDGYWLFHGDFKNSPYVYGRLVKLNPDLTHAFSRRVTHWGHDWMGNAKGWHDGHFGGEEEGYCSQILQCGKKVWFNIKTDTNRGGWVAARAKEIRIHDSLGWDTYTGEVDENNAQYLHGQIRLLFNNDIPDPWDGQAEIVPTNRTPDSTLGCNNVSNQYAGAYGPSVFIPRHEAPGWGDVGNAPHQYSDGTDSNEVRSSDGYIHQVYGISNTVCSNDSWVTGNFADLSDECDMNRSIAYKTYKQSMCRLPDSKNGVHWFASVGSINAGSGANFPTYEGDDIKVAGQLKIPRFMGNNGTGSTAYQNMWNVHVALHWLFTVGPSYQNVHEKLRESDVFTNYPGGEPDLNEQGLVDGMVRLDDRGGTDTDYFNLHQALGGNSMDNSIGHSPGSDSAIGRCHNGSVFPSDVASTFNNAFTSGYSSITEAMVEHYRVKGQGTHCTIAPVHLCMAEMPDIRSDIFGSGYLEGIETGDNPAYLEWKSVSSENGGSILESTWDDIRQTTDYSDASGANYDTDPIRRYPNDHYEDIIGIEAFPYLNHENNVVRGTANAGWFNNAYESGYGGKVTSATCNWTGGVTLAVLCTKDGVGQYKMPNGYPAWGGGGISAVNMCDANMDGYAGGAAWDDESGIGFWDICRFSRRPSSSTDWRDATITGFFSGGEGDERCSHGRYMSGNHNTPMSYSGGASGSTVAQPLSPIFLKDNNKLCVSGSWGSDLNPANLNDNYNNILWTDETDNVIKEPKGGSLFTFYSKGWNGFYSDSPNVGVELWGRENLSSGIDISGSHQNSHPIIQAQSGTANKLLITGNMVPPHTTVEAETTGGIGSEGTGHGVPPGFDLTAAAAYNTTNAHFDDLEHWIEAKILASDGVDFTVESNGGPSDGIFSDEKFYQYKVCFLYDGNQETPLSETTYTEGGNSVNFRRITLKLAANMIPRRCSHITIYRAECSSDNEEERDAAYRLIKQIPLTTGPPDDPFSEDKYPGFKTDPDVAAGWVIYKDDVGIDYFTDTGQVGMAYQAVNNMPETIEDFRVYYGLSTQINNEHIIGRCWRPELEGGERYIMKSKPGRFSTFNWLTDWLRLPTVPNALVAYRGRVYAFDEVNMYRIDPTMLRIEDIMEGVGCISPNAITVTDYGMVFCDRNNIYLHDGQRAQPIGDPILRNTSGDNLEDINAADNFHQDDGYQALVKNAYDNPMWGKPRVWTSWSGQAGSFLVGVTSSLSGYKRTYIYAYKPQLQRWDKWRVYLDDDEITALFLGEDGECYFPSLAGSGVTSSGMHQLSGMRHQHLIEEGQRKAFKWYSKKMGMGTSTQKKKLKNVKIVSNVDVTTNGDEIEIFLDGIKKVISGTTTDLSAGATEEEGSYLSEFKTTAGQNDFYGMKVKIEGTADTKIESIGCIFRRKSVK